MKKRAYILPKNRVAEIDPEYQIAQGYITGSYEKDERNGSEWNEYDEDGI